MTSATNPGDYVDFDEYVGLKLEKTRSTIRTTDYLTALAGVAAMFLGYLLVFVVLDQWVIRDGFGVFWRWVLLSTLVVSTIGWLVWKVAIPSFRTVSGLFAAQEIEKSEPLLKSNLLNLIDLKEAGRPINPFILQAMERQAAVRLQHVDVTQSIDHRPLIRTAYVLLAIIVVFCVYALLSPKKISNSIWRGLLPAAQVPPATVTEILDVKPGDITVPAHQPFVDVQVDLAGEIPPQVMLFYTTADGRRDQPVELRPDQEGQSRYHGQILGDGGQGLMQDLTYVVRAGDASSRQFKVTVEQPPYGEVESVRIEFPAYMKLQPVEQTANGAIDAWEGAKVVINAKTNMPVRTGMIQFVDDPQVGPTGEEVIMSVNKSGMHLQAQWTLALRADGTYPKYYRIHCKTDDGKVTTGHVMNPLTIRPDLPPEIVLLQPDRDLEAAANATIPLLIQAKDPDFELGYLYLNVEKAGQKLQHEQLSEGRQSRLTLQHNLRLSDLQAAAGDTIELWIEAYDNKRPRPNSKNTPKVKIRVTQPVSQKEAEKQLAEQKEQLDQKLAEADPPMNEDRAEAAQPMEGQPKDRQPRDDAHPKDADPNQPAAPREEKSQDEKPGQPQSKNQNNTSDTKPDGNQQNGDGASKGTPKRGGKNNPGDGANDPSNDENKRNKPLSNDGSQDDEALRRINEKLNKENGQKSSPSGEQQRKDKSEQPQSRNDESSPDRPMKNPQDKSEKENGSRSEAEKVKSTPEKSQSDMKQKSGDREENPANTDPSTKPSSNKNDDEQNKPNSQPKSDPTTGEKSQENKSPEKGKSGDKRTEDQNAADMKSTPKPSEKSDQPEKPDAAGAKANPSRDKPKPQSADEDKPSTGTDKTPAEKMSEEKTGNNKPGDQANQPDKSNDKPGDPKTEKRSSNDTSDSASKKPAGDKTDPSGNSKNDSSKPDGKTGSNDRDQKPSGQTNKPDSKPSGDKASDDQPAGGDKKSLKPEPSNKVDDTKPKRGDADPSATPSGPKEQVPDNPDAKKGKPDGMEKGVGKPDRDPKGEPAPAKNDDVKRNPDEKPETRPGKKPSDRDPADKQNGTVKKPTPQPPEDPPQETMPSKANDKSQDKTGGDAGTSKPEKDGNSGGKEQGPGSDSTKPGSQKQADRKSVDGPQESETKKADGTKQGDKPDSKTSSDSKSDPKGDGDKSMPKEEKPDSGDKPSGSPSDKNSSDKSSSQPKPGDSKSKESQPGGDQKNGSPSDKKSGGSPSTEKGAGKQGGSEKGESGQGKDQKPGGQNAGGKPSSQPGQSPNANGIGQAGGSDEASKGGDTPSPETSESANLEYNRQATELILQKLKKDLERGDVDPELLEQLGWTQTEMKQFADRLSKALSESKLAEDSPEAKAHQQQFQEMLKSLDLRKSGTQRTGAKEPKRDVSQIESRRTPPPPTYQRVFEKFTKEINRQKESSSDKSTK